LVCEIQLKFDDQKLVQVFPLTGDQWHLLFLSASSPPGPHSVST